MTSCSLQFLTVFWNLLSTSLIAILVEILESELQMLCYCSYYNCTKYSHQHWYDSTHQTIVANIQIQQATIANTNLWYDSTHQAIVANIQILQVA